MKRVTGIGGIFIKSADPARLRDWYKKHLGIEIEEWGGTAERRGRITCGYRTRHARWAEFCEYHLFLGAG